MFWFSQVGTQGRLVILGGIPIPWWGLVHVGTPIGWFPSNFLLMWSASFFYTPNATQSGSPRAQHKGGSWKKKSTGTPPPHDKVETPRSKSHPVYRLCLRQIIKPHRILGISHFHIFFDFFSGVLLFPGVAWGPWHRTVNKCLARSALHFSCCWSSTRCACRSPHRVVSFCCVLSAVLCDSMGPNDTLGSRSSFSSPLLSLGFGRAGGCWV